MASSYTAHLGIVQRLKSKGRSGRIRRRLLIGGRNAFQPSKKAKAEGRSILYVDESACYLLPFVAHSWAPSGQTPLLVEQAGRAHLNGPPLRYYKHRLAPFLYPYRYFKRMKKHNQEAYIKALERRLSATEAENQHLKFKAEAFETVIQIAE